MEKIYEIVRIKQEVRETLDSRFIIKSPVDAVEVAYQHIGEDDREVFFVMYLNTKNHVVAIHRCHVGTVNASIVSPRDVFKPAFLSNSISFIIVFHQHPSGDPKPSDEDIKVSRRLREAGKIIGIELLDSIILGGKNPNGKIDYVSLVEAGCL